MGLLQGLALYVLMEWMKGSDGAADRSWLVLWTLLIVLPALFMGMAVSRWRQAALWAGGAVMAAVVLAMGGWAVWRSLHSEAGYGGTLLRLVGAIALWWFVALAWFQARLEQGSWRIAYGRLFVHAWNNALVLALASLCVQLIWGVLWLWAGLFALVGVKWFATLFSQMWFVLPVTGMAAGLGLWMARTQERPIQMARQVLLALGRLLLPLMAWVLVLFVAMLVFTGVEKLWATRFAAALLMCVLLAHLWLVNAVYQDGAAPQGPYPRWVLHLVHASLLAMPVLATLASVAVGLRVAQYGWTAERLWAAAGSGLLWLYAAGYAWAAIDNSRTSGAGQGRPWLSVVSGVNRGMSLLVLAVLLALQTPLLDPDRLSARSQLAQLASGAQTITPARLKALKFDHGPYGAAALSELAQSPTAQQAQVKAWIEKIAGSATRADAVLEREDEDEVVDVPTAQTRIRTVAGDVPAADWWLWLQAQTRSQYWASSCVAEDAQCVLVGGDWDKDGQTDYLLCNLGSSSPRCQLTAREASTRADVPGSWRDEGRVQWPYMDDAHQRSSLSQALRSGQVQTLPPRWPQWQVQVQDGEQNVTPAVGQQEVMR